MLGGFDLGGVLLVNVAQGGDVGMAEQRVVLEGHLGVEAEQVALFRHHQRVDLDEARVLVEEQFVQARDEARALLGKHAFELERGSDHAAMEGAQARGRIDGKRRDLLGRLGGDFLDVDAAFGRGDEGDATGGPVDEKREVKLAGDGRVLHHIDAADHAALGPGLRRDERLAQHTVSLGMQLLQCLHELDAAAFASPARVDLRLHHEGAAAERLGMRLGFMRRRGDAAVGDRRAVLLEEILGLIFVDVHGNTLRCPDRGRMRRG